jgi:DNA-binding IscR family transcriptional regulator
MCCQGVIFLSLETEMQSINDYLFGNRALHEQWRGSTQILVTLAEHAPRPVRIEQLCAGTGRTLREVSKLCRGLENAGLLRKPSSKRREWQLTCDANALTLETVYLCVLEEAERDVRKDTVAIDAPDKSLHRIDVLLTQAAMSVHQSVLTHLRQFSIGTIRRRQSFDLRDMGESLLRSRWDSVGASIAY